jgi:hypothetical protein
VDSGYRWRSFSRRFRMRLSTFLLSLSLIGVMGVLPTHTIFGFLGSPGLPTQPDGHPDELKRLNSSLPDRRQRSNGRQIVSGRS